MKISIAIQAASDGGVFITIDPSADEIQRQVDVGRGTSAHTYALIAYRAMHAEAERAAAGGGYMDAGEIPPEKH